jgi:hypothetical protein
MGACSPWLGSPRSGRRRVGKGLAGAGAPGPLAPPVPAANLVGAAAPAPALYSYILATPYIETPGANNRRFFFIALGSKRQPSRRGGACVRACVRTSRPGRAASTAHGAAAPGALGAAAPSGLPPSKGGAVRPDGRSCRASFYITELSASKKLHSRSP